jgi:DNA helicase-2/ATP-dependent DNA helicase PcrA
MFLEELPGEVETLDLSASAAGSARAMAEWRGGGKDAEQGWKEAGIDLKGRERSGGEAAAKDGYAEGVLVKHETYGTGKVTAVSGYGAMRKVKVRFPTAGEKTFVVEKAKLEIVRKP